MPEDGKLLIEPALKKDVATSAVEGSLDVLKTIISDTNLSMVATVALCELLQWVKVADYVPGHWETYKVPLGSGYTWENVWVEAQPRRMLLSQPLSTTMETAIIGSVVLKSLNSGVAGSAILSLVKGFMK